MQDPVSEILQLASLTRSEIARRSGVHRSTLYRPKNDGSDHRLSTVREIALACGFDVDISLRPTCDPAASDAGRLMLDTEVPGVDDPTVLEWISRLDRYAGDDPLRVAQEAGKASSLLPRTHGVTFMVGQFTADRLASAGYASNQVWALSGTPVLESFTGEGDTDPLAIIWCQNPRPISQLLADTGQTVSNPTKASLVIATAGILTLTGCVDLDGIRMVSPVQGIIDCMGLRERDRVAATEIAREW